MAWLHAPSGKGFAKWLAGFPAVRQRVSSEPYKLPSAAAEGVYGARVVHEEDASPDDPCEHLLRAVLLSKAWCLATAASAHIQEEPTCPVDPGLPFLRRVFQAMRERRWLEGHGLSSFTHISVSSKDNWAARLESFRQLTPGWDSYHAEPPTLEVVRAAEKFLAAVRAAAGSRLRLSKLNPSVVGGVGFTFRNGVRTVYIEFRNTGNAHVAFMASGSEPEVAKINQDSAGYSGVIAKVEKHLNEQTARGDESKRTTG